MSVVTGRNAVIKIGTSTDAASAADVLTGLQNWSIDAPDTIDVTVAGNAHKRMIAGLQAGMITAETIDDDDAALATAVTSGLANTASNVYFYSDGGTTPDYSWRAIVTSNFNTSGPNDAAKRTVTFYRQADVDPANGNAE